MNSGTDVPGKMPTTIRRMRAFPLHGHPQNAGKAALRRCRKDAPLRDFFETGNPPEERASQQCSFRSTPRKWPPTPHSAASQAVRVRASLRSKLTLLCGLPLFSREHEQKGRKMAKKLGSTHQDVGYKAELRQTNAFVCVTTVRQIDQKNHGQLREQSSRWMLGKTRSARILCARSDIDTNAGI